MTEPRVTYRRSPINEWTAPAFRRLSEDAKLVLLAARLGPSSNMIGISYCPATQLAAYTGLPLNRVEAAEAELTPDFLERDQETDELLVVDGLEHQVSDVLKPGDKRLPHILGLLVATHSDTLRNRWAGLHPTIDVVSTVRRSPFKGACQAPSKPVAVAVPGAAAAEGAGAAAAGGGEASIQPPEAAGSGLAAPPAAPAERVTRLAEAAASLGLDLRAEHLTWAVGDVLKDWDDAELHKALHEWAAQLKGKPPTVAGFRNYIDRRGHRSQHSEQVA